MRVALINTTADPRQAPGRVVLELARGVARSGGEALVAYGRGAAPAAAEAGVEFLRIGGAVDSAEHFAASRLADVEGLASRGATRSLMARLEAWRPTVVHLHNLHGHYLNLPLLFDGLSRLGVVTVVTLHDCWLLTGHCAFPAEGCRRCEPGRSGCRRLYPPTLWLRRERNLRLRRGWLAGLKDVTLVSPSPWMTDMAAELLPGAAVQTIPLGVDTRVFRPSAEVREPGLIFAAANVWEPRKGLSRLLGLRLRAGERLVIAGKGSRRQRAQAEAAGAAWVGRLSPEEMAGWYSRAEVVVNPSGMETFSMVTLEALACGTPVVVDSRCASAQLAGAAGVAVDTADAEALRQGVEEARRIGQEVCLGRAAMYPVSAMVERYMEVLGRKGERE